MNHFTEGKAHTHTCSLFDGYQEFCWCGASSGDLIDDAGLRFRAFDQWPPGKSYDPGAIGTAGEKIHHLHRRVERRSYGGWTSKCLTCNRPYPCLTITLFEETQ